MSLDIQRIRKDFPILERRTSDDVLLVYLDSTATSQKPLSVIEAMNDYYRRSNANIHRGVHTLAEEATALYEGAREKIAQFINAPHARQVIYTRNTTESINLVAYTWARANLKAGDLVILTEMEHHSNLVPWHILAAERGIELRFIPVTDSGELELEALPGLLADGRVRRLAPHWAENPFSAPPLRDSRPVSRANGLAESEVRERILAPAACFAARRWGTRR